MWSAPLHWADSPLPGRHVAAKLPALLAYASDRDLPPDAIAIAAAIAQPWADVVLSGAVSPQMLASNLRALERVHDGSRPADELPQLRLAPDAYWQRRSQLPRR